MAEQGERRHIIFSGRTTTERYTSPSQAPRFIVLDKNRSEHAISIREKLERVQQEISNAPAPVRTGLIREDCVYVEFVSDINVRLAFDSFEDGRSGNYHLLRTDQEGEKYRALVALNQDGVSSFIRKIEEYATRETRKTQAPLHRNLFQNISDIQVATLKAFWNEPSIAFPSEGEEVWWEVWLRRKNFEEDDREDSKVEEQLRIANVRIGDKRLLFPEHIIRLIKGTASQLSASLLLLDNLAELRKPKETAEFFTDLTGVQQNEWLEELRNRTDIQTGTDVIAICILDTGVNNSHPLLSPFLPAPNMDTYNPSWGVLDGYRGGHGTQMAGLAVYGDLTDCLASRERLQVYHVLESIKMLNTSDPHDPDIYGQVTIECVSRAVVISATRKRVFCMAVTSDDSRDAGKPSSWSTSVDKIAFGESGTSNDKSLFLISSGNVQHNNPDEYPAKNLTDSVHDPGQAFNALTIGGYTEKDLIDLVRYPDAAPLAMKGDMAPCNSTSLTWKKWPIKPDVVFEAGNYARQHNAIIIPDSLQVLTTAKDFSLNQFVSFGDTSGAAALASNFAARLYSQYPNLWPESIRAIIVHSATWTPVMLRNQQLGSFTREGKRALLRSFGFGVPNFSKAVASLTNCLTLIAEREIQPYERDGSAIKTKDMHIFQLPWPSDALQELGATAAKLTVTLSYFIEPNPGSRYYSSKFNYQSHGLRFKIKRPLESLGEFKIRINRAARDEDEEYEQGTDEDQWLLGERLRNIGSIQKDIWSGTGSELASMNYIAVHPVNGWWRFRTKLRRFDQRVRYSLTMTIETTAIDVDLYTPVNNIVSITV